MGAEHLDRLVVLDQLVDQVARRAGREALRRHHGAIVPLEPAVLLEGLLRAFLLDVEQLVEVPGRPLVLLDHQGAERDRLVAVRMGDRAARLAVHQRDFAVLFLVVVDDAGEVADLEFLAGLLHDDRAHGVEQLARIEAVALRAAADGVDDLGEMVEHHVLLRLRRWRSAGATLRIALAAASAMAPDERLKVRLLAVRGDRHVGRRDVEPET